MTPYRSPFRAKGPGKEKKKVPSLLCIALLRSRIFQDGSKKACAVPISCQLTQSCVPTDKTHGLSILCSSSTRSSQEIMISKQLSKLE